MEKALVFNIQKYCVHDGPGIRSIVFFKGCPLHCQWCSNPEGIAACAEISYKVKKCISVEKCGYCIKHCPENAISTDKNGAAQIDRSKCSKCLKCADICPAKAMEVMGNWMSVEEILDKIEEDSAFYSRSGGGLTLSGGEPLLQSKFVAMLLREARSRGLETAIETTGCAPWEDAEIVFKELDYIHYDLKIFDNEKHKKYTGQSNELILQNFVKLCQNFKDTPIVVRTPVIPGINDTIEDIQAIADFINEVGKDVKKISYELLAFHNFGSSKYEFQGKTYALNHVKNMDKEVIQKLKEEVRSEIELI